MQLVDLSQDYGDFYAPAFTILKGKQDLLRDLYLPVSQLEVTLTLGLTSHFQFTIVNCFDVAKHAFRTEDGKDPIGMLDFGTKLDFHMGYGDRKSVRWMLTGLVHNIATNFPEAGSPELVISGTDAAFPMTLGRNARSWVKARDSKAVAEVASDNNLSAKIDDTEVEHEQIEQNHQSDWAFLAKLAKRNHFELYIDQDGKLHFEKPQDDATAVIDLAWGEGLLSFAPEANLAGQFSKVEIYGWDRKTKKPIVGVAKAGQESGGRGKGSGGKSAGELMTKVQPDAEKQPVIRLREPVFSQAEANQRAKAVLDENAKKFLTGHGETIGVPELRPDRRVNVRNIGAPFSRIYYLEEATHKIDGNGYRTRFKVSDQRMDEVKKS